MRSGLLILFAEPLVPNAPVYGTFDAANKAANVSLVLSNTRMVRTATAGHGQARSTATMANGRYYWETKPTSSSASTLASGIAIAGFPLDVQIGSNAGSIGIWGNTGNFVFNGGGYSGVGAVASTDVLRHYLDLTVGTYAVQKNAGAIVQYPGPSLFAPGLKRQSWFAASSTNLSGHGWDFRTGGTGASVLTYAVPEGYQPLAMAQTWSPTVVRLATEPFVMPNGQVWGFEANQWFDGRISRRHDLMIAGEVGCWPLGTSSKGAVGALVLDNADGALDAWQSWRWRNLRVKLIETRRSDLVNVDPNDDNLLWMPVVDRVEPRGNEMRLIFAEPAAALVRELQTTDMGEQSRLDADRTLDVVGEDQDGRLVPLCLGQVDQVSPYNVNPNPAVREYQYADGPCMALRAAYDKCDPYDLSPSVADVRVTRLSDGFRINPAVSGPVGKVTADLLGTGQRGTQRITLVNGGSFDTWGGSPNTPTGWTYFTVPNAGNRWVQVGTTARCLSNGGAVQTLGHATAYTNGAYIEVQFEVLSVTLPGPLYLITDDGLGTATVVNRFQINGPGLHRAVIKANNTTTLFRLGLSWGGGGAGDVIDCTIDNLQTWEVTAADTFRRMVDAIFVRTPDSGSVDSTTADLITTEAPWAVGLYADGGITARDALQALLDSFGAWAWTNRFGVWHFGRLREPIGAPALELTIDNVARVECALELAKGLTTRAWAVRNYSPTDENSFAGSVSLADRRRWSQPYQVLTSAPGIVHPTYAHAQKADPLATLLQTPKGAATEIRRAAEFFRHERFVYRADALLDLSTARNLDLGSVVRLTFPRYDLHAGKKLLVLGRSLEFWGRRVPLLLLG